MVLEKLYEVYSSEAEDSNEIKVIEEKLNKYNKLLKSAFEHHEGGLFEYDKLIMLYALEHQKQGFMAGFEMARQLLLGGKL